MTGDASRQVRTVQTRTILALSFAPGEGFGWAARIDDGRTAHGKIGLPLHERGHLAFWLMSVLTGGATGVVGSLLAKGIGLFEACQRRKERQIEFAHELELLDRQAAMGAAESESALRIGAAEAAARLREASYGNEAGAGASYPWVAAVLRLVRPALTLFLIGLVAAIYATTVD